MDDKLASMDDSDKLAFLITFAQGRPYVVRVELQACRFFGLVILSS